MRAVRMLLPRVPKRLEVDPSGSYQLEGRGDPHRAHFVLGALPALAVL